jgi:hypothetical protein
LQSEVSVGRNARGVGSEVEFLVKKSEVNEPDCFAIPKGPGRFEHLLLGFEICLAFGACDLEFCTPMRRGTH